MEAQARTRSDLQTVRSLSTSDLPHTMSDQDPMTMEKRALTLRVVQVYQAVQVGPCTVTNILTICEA